MGPAAVALVGGLLLNGEPLLVELHHGDMAPQIEVAREETRRLQPEIKIDRRALRHQAIAIVAVTVADLATTEYQVHRRGVGESNPLMAGGTTSRIGLRLAILYAEERALEKLHERGETGKAKALTAILVGLWGGAAIGNAAGW